MDFRLISLPQVNGVCRVIAVTPADKQRYDADRAVLDAIKPLGCVDVPRYGQPEWGATGPRFRDIDPEVRKALEWEIRGA